MSSPALPHGTVAGCKTPLSQTSVPPLRLLLVDDHELLRRGAAALLEEQSGWTIVGEASDGESAVRLAGEVQPDIVVMDVGMRDLNGFQATREILKTRPKTQVLIFTMHEGEHVVRETIAAGAQGYVHKSDAGQHLIPAVQALREAQPYFSSPFAARILEEREKLAAS